MDLREAINKHGEWRVKLRSAILNKQQLDANTLSVDNQCEIGKWLHGEARAKYSHLPAYKQCVDAHAAFHRAAGEIARAINRNDEKAAMAMLAAGTPYSAASTGIGVALLALQRELPSAA